MTLASTIVMRAAGLTELNKYSSILISLPFAIYGAKFPDYDIAWDKIADKNLIKFLVNKFITLTGGKHRSRHTHSFDVVLFMLVLGVGLNKLLYSKRVITFLDSSIINVTVISFVIGWLSHLLCDMLNPSGVYLSCFTTKIRLRVVPKKILWFNTGTGDTWESIVYRISAILNVVLGLIIIFINI